MKRAVAVARQAEQEELEREKAARRKEEKAKKRLERLAARQAEELQSAEETAARLQKFSTDYSRYFEHLLVVGVLQPKHESTQSVFVVYHSFEAIVSI